MSQQAQKEMQSRINKLQQMPVSSIKNLPNRLDEDVVVEGIHLSIVTWHDILDSHQHMIAVQVYEKAVAGVMGHMYSDGFVISEDGKKRPLADQEWYQFS